MAQNIPPPPPGFVPDMPTAGPSPLPGRPIIRKGADAPSPPSGYRPTKTGGLEYIPGGPADPNIAPPKKAEAPSGYRFKADGSLEAIPGGPADKTNAGDPLQAAVKGLGLDELLFNSKRARDQINNTWATGALGTISGMSPFAGSDRADFLGTLQSLQGGIILEKLQALKDASKTGASGMGALSEKEGERLAAAVSAVNENMSGDELLKSLDVIDRHAKILQAVGNGENPDDPAVQQKYGIKPFPDGQPQDGTQDGTQNESNDKESGLTLSDLVAGKDKNTPPPSPNFTPSTDGTRSVIDPAKQELGGKIAGLMTRGADRNTIMGFAVRADPTLRNDPKFLNWVNEALKVREQNRKAGKNVPFSVDPGFYTTQVPLTDAERLLNRATQTDAGGAAAAYAAGAGNAVLAGGLDEIVGLTGGDADRAQQNKQFVRDEHPLASFAGEVTGAGLGAKGLSKINLLKANPMAADIIYGSLYGAGESNDNRIGGAALGGGSAFLGNKLVNVLGNLTSGIRAARAASRAEGRDVAEAADRLGMDVLPADVGGTFAKKMTAAAAQGPVSAIPIVKAAQKVTQGAAAARDRIAANVGNAGERELAGETAKSGAQGFIKRTRDVKNDLYRRAESLAGDTRVKLPRALDAIDRNIAELEQIPGGAAGLNELKDLRAQMAGDFTVQGVRGMRTQLRDKFIKEGLRGSDLERRVNQVMKAATDDMAQGLADQGLQNAAGVYKQADRYTRMRLSTIDETLAPIIGKKGDKSGEEVMAGIERAAKGNNARLSRFMTALQPDERGDVTATIISGLGRSSNGTQNAAGDAFSLPQFLTHWNALTPGAKRTLFQGDTRKALDDLAKVSEGAKEAQRHQNFSNTAGGITGAAILTGAPLYAGNLLLTAGSLLTQYGAGKLLASPRFARWLVGAGRTSNPGAHIEKLARIASVEAPIAAEISGLRSALLNAVNDNRAVAPLAASPNAEGQNNERR